MRLSLHIQYRIDSAAMQKKAEFKLPQIKKTHKQSSILLSKTISESGCTPKVRPASSTKVEDLEKKLFHKLEAYDHGSRKKLSKKVGKLAHGPALDPTHPDPADGYERMQKLMPALYSKLLETKKGNYVSQNLISEFDIPLSENAIQTAVRLEATESIKPASRDEQSDPVAVPQEQDLYSQQQMAKIFKQYEQMQGLPAQTSSQEMQQLGASIQQCENSIEQIRLSMEGLIHEIGMEYIGQIERDEQLDFSRGF